MMWLHRTWILLLFLVLLAGCATSPDMNAAEMEKRLDHQIWFHENEAKKLDDMGMEWQAEIEKDVAQKLKEQKYKDDSFLDFILDLFL